MRRLAFALGLCSVTGLAPGVASAQEEPRDGAFGVQNFNPALGPQNFLSVEGARVGNRNSYSVGLVLNYAHDPFVVFDATCEADVDLPGNQDCPGDFELEGEPKRIVERQITGNFLGTFVPIRHLQIGLDLPLTFVDGNGIDVTTGDLTGQQRAVGLGDPRLLGKYRFVGNGTGVGLAGSLAVSVPFAQIAGQDPEETHLGSDWPVVVPRVVLDFRRSRYELAANLGANLRPRAKLFSTEVGIGASYGLAFGYQFSPQFRALAEVTGAATFSSQVDENPLEGDAAVQYRVNDLLFTLGGGGGLLRGVGVPSFRVLGGVLYSPVRGDVDADGVDDRIDRCQDEPEDMDGFQDEDGCPESDNDEDGFADSSDRCPNDAEDQDRHQDEDGCPDLDNDGDGVRDGYDSCPNQPEDIDRDRDDDGCPDHDTDGDNINDAEDRCPSEMEDTDGFEDEDGCPEADNDHDCVVDEQDQCNEQAEDADGFEDEDGCPDEDNDGDTVLDATDKCPMDPGRTQYSGCSTMRAMRDAVRNPPPAPPARDCGGPATPAPAAPAPAPSAPEPAAPATPAVQLEQGRIRVEGVINFRPNRDVITPDSHGLLDQVAVILQAHPEIAHLRIEGHTDNSGARTANVRLSGRRAAAVRRYLVDKGIAADRLTSEGHGPDRPIAPNDTPENRSKNRRVEFNIVADEPATPPATPPQPRG